MVLEPPAATERSLFFNSSTLALESGSLSGRGWGERREKDICKHQKERMGKTETKKILQKL